jgi:hypothetical protein
MPTPEFLGETGFRSHAHLFRQYTLLRPEQIRYFQRIGGAA